MYGMPLRKGVSMRVDGVFLNRTDLHQIAAELNIETRDILSKDRVLTIYNTSDFVQELLDNNALVTFIAMTLEIAPEDISDIKEVEEERVKLEFDLSDFEDDD